jgi:hypothetical protein
VSQLGGGDDGHGIRSQPHPADPGLRVVVVLGVLQPGRHLEQVSDGDSGPTVSGPLGQVLAGRLVYARDLPVGDRRADQQGDQRLGHRHGASAGVRAVAPPVVLRDHLSAMEDDDGG